MLKNQLSEESIIYTDLNFVTVKTRNTWFKGAMTLSQPA